MSRIRSDFALAASLVFAVFLWGGHNTGTRFIVGIWPPIWTGASRFVCAGLLMLILLRWTRWLGTPHHLTREMKVQLWWRGGLSLAAYTICFNWALHLTSASHVTLYLGASPVWALLWEGKPDCNRAALQRYAAAGLALAGVIVLFWPALDTAGTHLAGEALGLVGSVLWTNFNRQCRVLGATLSGAEVTAHTMWRTGLLLTPLGLIEIARAGLVWRADVAWVMAYCILAGGVTAFALWSNALRHWPASQVMLFNNLIPISTMAWAHFCLGEAVTPSFWTAMALILGGVIWGQLLRTKLQPFSAMPPE